MKSIVFKSALFTAIFLLFMLTFWGGYNYRNQKNRSLQNLLNQGKFLVQTYAPLAAKALQFKDDLALITYMQNLMEQPNVLYAMVLNPKGDVLAHHKATEIGKSYVDTLTLKSLKTEQLQILPFTSQEYGKYEVYDFSLPLIVQGNKTGILRLGISTGELKTTMEKYLENLVLISILISISGIIASYFFTHLLILPIQRVKEVIEDIGKGNIIDEIKFCRKDELGELLQTAKQTVSQIAENYKKYESEIVNLKERFKIYLSNLGPCLGCGVIFTDADNKIVYLNESGKKILFTNETNLIGKHILEVSRNVEFIDLLKKATGSPNQVIIEEIKSVNQKIKIVSIEDKEKNLIGTLTLTD